MGRLLSDNDAFGLCLGSLTESPPLLMILLHHDLLGRLLCATSWDIGLQREPFP